MRKEIPKHNKELWKAGKNTTYEEVGKCRFEEAWGRVKIISSQEEQGTSQQRDGQHSLNIDQ